MANLPTMLLLALAGAANALYSVEADVLHWDGGSDSEAMLVVGRCLTGEGCISSETGARASRLLWSQSPPNIITGDRLVISSAAAPSLRLRSLISGAERNTLLVTNYSVLPRPVVAIAQGLDAVMLRMITFVINVGGAVPDTPFSDLESRWFSPAGQTQAKVTMQDYVHSCSYGKMKLTESDGASKLVDLTALPMPVAGTSIYTRLRYNTTAQCNYPELYAMQEWAQYQYSLIVGDNVTIDKFNRRSLVVPLTNCDWWGFGSKGCIGRYCYMWIRGDRMSHLNTHFHELGHSLTLEHSHTPTADSGDCTCVMGCSTELGCPNAPASLRAGWSIPITTLSGSNLAPGQWHNFTIPAFELSDINMIRIFPNWTAPQWSGSALPAYYISMKIPIGYDTYAAQLSRVNIHISNFTSTSDRKAPFLIGSLPVTAWFKDTVTRLNIAFTAVSATTARVKVCRYTVTKESGALCSNGLDDDCSGRADGDDASCAAVSKCGDGRCTAGETAQTCSEDCVNVQHRRSLGTGGALSSHTKHSALNGIVEAGRPDIDVVVKELFGNNRKSSNVDAAVLGSFVQQGPFVCGDGLCGGNEDVSSCAMDCCPRGTCGDGTCQAWLGENCESCPDDCRGNLDEGKTFCCGAYVGCGDERCSSGHAKCQVSCSIPEDPLHSGEASHMLLKAS